MVPWTQLLPPESVNQWLTEGKRVCQGEGEHICSVPHLSLNICYNHRSGPAWPRSGLFGWPHALQLACQPKHFRAVRASATKQNILINLSRVTSPLPRATLSPFKWRQGQPILPAPAQDSSDSRQRGLDPQPVKISWTETSFCNTKVQRVLEQRSIYMQLHDMQRELKSNSYQYLHSSLQFVFWLQGNNQDSHWNANV